MSYGKTDDWRNRILRHFTPKVAGLTLAADPDALLLEENLLDAIRERGFEVLVFDDPVAFRFAYETGFRFRRDRGEVRDLVVVLQTGKHDLATLPYDLLQVGRQLSFGLEELFPHLSYPVVASLDRSNLDALYRARAQHGFIQCGDDATKDFVLLHVFGISVALIRDGADLLRVLLRKHYRRQRLPRSLEQCLVHKLRQDAAFDSWPLETIVPDREAFLSFLQDHWSPFLDRIAWDTEYHVRDANAAFDPAIAGPVELPFDHGDVRIYIDNLFVEGLLSPVHHRSSDALNDRWVAVGIRNDNESGKSRRLRSLMDTVANTIPDTGARHYDWTAFAWRWAELGLLWSDTTDATRSGMNERMRGLRRDVDRSFCSWTECRYAGLHNQPPDPPVMVHHLPRYLERRLSNAGGNRVALVVVDGLALDQWIALRDILALRQSRFRFREEAVFAWIPTVTSVSRQAIFAGTPPLYFPSSLWTTDREASLWTRFWTDHGLTVREVTYARGLGSGCIDSVRELLSWPGLRVLGLVVDKVDRIMHGMELGAAGMHNQVRQWADEGFMVGLLNTLLEGGFAVFLTSDHGNIEAEGIGRPSEGMTAALRGERVRVYSDPSLRSRVHNRFPDAVVWPALGLPEDCLPLLAPARSAFVREGERIVCHGGASLEEVVVPMVEIERVSA